jgi:hypothetical protein
MSYSKFIFVFIIMIFSLKSVSIEPREELVIHVSDTKSLYAAVRTANKRQGYAKIILASGTYKLKQSLRLRFDHITLTSESSMPEDVVIIGVGMMPSNTVHNLIDVNGSYVKINGVTLSQASHHLIQVHGKKNADYFTLTNSHLRDSYQQLLKVTSGKGKEVDTSDFGIIKNCLFEYSKGVGPNYYIGGIDAHNAHNWLVEKNTFKSIASPGKQVAQFAIHFWNGSTDIIIRENTIIDSDRGIGFGMKRQKLTSNATITNNYIVHNNLTHKFADVGIALLNSPNVLIENNKILLSHSYPNAIEYRFRKTKNIIIRKNIVNKKITNRNNASAKVVDNIFVEIK